MEEIANENLRQKVSNSFKWTTAAEFFSKIVSPLTNMVLARLISSEIFGIVASIQVVVSFAEMVSEGGYARFILQKKFASDNEKKTTIGTGLFVSMVLGVFLFSAVFFSRNFLASLVRADGYEWLLVLAASQLPFYSIVNILIALCRREFNFKVLTLIRIASVILQFVISVCLAFFGLKVWAVTIASLSSILFQLAVLLVFLRKQICLRFSLKCFKESWAVSSGFLLSAFATWLCTSANTICASYFIGQSQAGVLKNGFSTVSGIISMLTAIYSPVLISYLAKLDTSDPSYKVILYRFQKVVSSIFIPLGVGMFVFQGFLSDLFFGSGWEDAALVIGCIGLMNCLKICTSDFVSVLYNAQGKPGWIVLSDGLYAVAIILVWVIFGYTSFTLIVFILGAAILVPMTLNLSLCKRNTKISPIPLLTNAFLIMPFAILMGLFGLFLSRLYSNFYINFLYISLCVFLYFSVLLSSDVDFLSDYYFVFGIKVLRKFQQPYLHIPQRK